MLLIKKLILLTILKYLENEIRFFSLWLFTEIYTNFIFNSNTDQSKIIEIYFSRSLKK